MTPLFQVTFAILRDDLFRFAIILLTPFERVSLAMRNRKTVADLCSTPIQRTGQMRTFIFAVAAIIAASWAIDQARAADRIPAFDVVRNCNAEVANVGTEKVADCTKDETDAKNELDQSWPQFRASDKQTCVGESSIGGGQSYVELLTCLEMSSGEFLAGGHQISPLDQPVGAMDQQRSTARFCSVRCRVAARRAR